MLYTIYCSLNNQYSVFDPDLDLVSRWKSDIADATLADSYAISTHWASMYGQSHEEILQHINTHEYFILVDMHSTNSTYEYW